MQLWKMHAEFALGNLGPPFYKLLPRKTAFGLETARYPRELFSVFSSTVSETAAQSARSHFMLRSTTLAAFGLWSTLLAAPLVAETTPAPPDWQDGHGTSTYLQISQQAPPAGVAAGVSENAALRSRSASGDAGRGRHNVSNGRFRCTAGRPRSDVAGSPSSERRLAPPTNRDELPSNQMARSTGGRHLADFGVPAQSIYTIVTALAIVIGAFLLFAWALRRSGRSSGNRRGMLPADAVSVLGRVPLAARQFAELLRVGNKLVLVALTPSGPKTLTEVTDPLEVDRLVGLCQQIDPKSTTKAFEQVFQQLSNEPAVQRVLGQRPVAGVALGRGVRVPQLNEEPRVRNANRITVLRCVAAIGRLAAGRRAGLRRSRCRRSAGLLPKGIGGPADWTSPQGLASTLQIMLLLTVVSLAPAILLMTTGFVRIIVVLGLLRQALGTQQLPPSQVITSIALFMTLLLMAPVWSESYEKGIQPYTNSEISLNEAFTRSVAPMRRVHGPPDPTHWQRRRRVLVPALHARGKGSVDRRAAQLRLLRRPRRRARSAARGAASRRSCSAN